MNDSRTFRITSLKVRGFEGSEKLKIHIDLDVMDEKLIFRGFYKGIISTTSGTFLIAEEKHDPTRDNERFEIVVKRFIRIMRNRIDMINLVDAFLHEVDEIEIKENYP